MLLLTKQKLKLLLRLSGIMSDFLFRIISKFDEITNRCFHLKKREKNFNEIIVNNEHAKIHILAKVSFPLFLNILEIKLESYKITAFKHVGNASLKLFFVHKINFNVYICSINIT